MSTINERVFVLANQALFEQLTSDSKLFTFEKFLPGMDQIPVGTKVIVEFGRQQVNAEVVKISSPHPSFKNCGSRIEIRVC
jgi:hypothetical protein